MNRRTTSDVRATVHSFLSQSESAGEVLGSFALAGALVARSRADRPPASAAGAAD